MNNCNKALTINASKDFDFQYVSNHLLTDTIKETMGIVKEIQNSTQQNMMSMYLYKKYHVGTFELSHGL